MPAVRVFDLVIFDYDGTLCDTRLAIAHCVELAFATLGRAIFTPEQALQAVAAGLSLQETCLLLDGSLRGLPAELDELVQTYRSLYRSEGEPLIRMFPGVTEAVRQVRARGARCVIVSNKGIDAVRRSLDRHQLTSLVDLVWAEQPGLPTKPDPTLLTDHILPKFPSAAKRRVLMVGDTETDIQFAKRAGIPCCWASYGFGDRDRCSRLEPEFQIGSLAELPALI